MQYCIALLASKLKLKYIHFLIRKFHFRLQVYYDAGDNSIWKNVKIYVTILFSPQIWCILIYKNMHHSCSLTFDDLWSNYVSDWDISLFDLNINICLLITKTTIKFWDEKIISSSLIMCKYLMLHLLKNGKKQPFFMTQHLLIN